MTNNLRKVKKELCTFAKKCQRFKYTDSALIIFLITGAVNISNNLFSAEPEKNIENQKQIIFTSIKDIHHKVQKTKKENDKLLKKTNLELIQLMEQGDHVIKLPWNNWQYGINEFYNNWSGTYKGKGDKSEKYSYEGIFERNPNLFGRSVSPLSKNYGNLLLDRNKKMASSNERNGLRSTYGLISSTPTQEPLLEMNVNASIKPKTVQIEIPDLGIRAPQLNALSVNGVEPRAVTIPTPKTPEKEINIVQPNASPFTGFFFNGANGELPNNSNNADTIYYAGVNPDIIKAKIAANQPLENVGPDPNNLNTGALKKSDLSTILNHNKRPTNILYRWGVNLNNLTFYIRGYFDDGSDGYIDDGSGHTGGSDPTGGPTLGTIGVHTLLNSTVSNITANLYGRAGFLTSETWKHGKVTMVNTNVNVYGKENSVYYVMPGAFRSIAVNINPNYYLGALRGTTNVKIYGTGNTVYLSSGISGPRLIVNDGKIESEGASNIIYSSFSYAPNWEKSSYSRGTNEMNSSIQLISDNNLYGDENVVLFFGSKMGGTTTPKSWGLVDKNNEIAHGYLTKASYIGIYQGEIDVKATIGKQLAIDSNATTQTTSGQLLEDLSNPAMPKYKGYTNKTVDGGVGLYVTSGQRIGIDAIRDLGVPVTYVPNLASFSNDSIHNLEVGKMDIRFGKYSKNGFMVISKLGSVVDVGKASTNYHVTTTSSSITDGINGATTSEADASTGTTIAYAEGTWDQVKHQLGSKQTNVNQNNADAVAINGNPALRKNIGDPSATSTASILQGLPSEVNIYPNVVLASKEGIAYMGDNKGIVNAGTSTNPITTEAVNYKSIIGFARDEGTVNIHSDIEAIDKNATKNKFENIAGLATKTAAGTVGGTVNIENGTIKISGMAGFASGAGSVVNINNGTGNNIQTGENGALAAINGGKVNFSGGTIYQEDKATTSNVVAIGTSTVNHSKSTPFYADNSSKIEFKGTTSINMSDGILMPGTFSTDYDGGNTSTTAKYLGMNHVTVNLTGDNAILRTYTGDTTNWTGGTTGSTNIKNDMQLAALNTNNHDYKIYYVDGIFNLNNNQDLDINTDEFNTKIGLSNEKFTIANNVTVSSVTGKGLAMASHHGVATNATTGYTNNGTVNITGGTTSKTTAVSTSFGYVDNKGAINVDKGIGAYGINGSNLINNNTVNVTSSGVGMAGFASASKLKTYGTDDKISNGTLITTDKVLEITNNGTVTVAGTGSIGLYGNTNDVTGKGLVTTSNGIITNNNKIIMTGDSGVGIVSEGAGNIINLGGTGNSDISVGTNGIGVYASGTKSEVNLISNTGVEIKDKGVGISVSSGSIINPNGNTFEIKYTGSSNASGAGIFYNNTATNMTDINIVNISSDKGIVGIYTTGGILTNTATITDKSGKAYGIYSDGADVVNSGILTMKNKGKGILSTNGNVTLTSNSVITLGENEAIGVYIKGTDNQIKADVGSKMTIGNGSYGFVNEGTGNTITSNATVSTVGDNTVFVFSRDVSGTVINNTSLTSSGSLNYGLYSAGNIINNSNINYGSGIGNVGIYSINGGTASNSNSATITVGASSVGNIDPKDNKYAIGMAAGYFGDPTTSSYTGNVVNKGIINVNGEHSIGMYGTERGTIVTNNGIINLNASNTTGMYLDNGAYGINNGTIQSNGTGLKRVVGMVVKNGSIIENNGIIQINATDAVGLLAKGNSVGRNVGIIKNYGTLDITGSGATNYIIPSEGQDLAKDMGGVKIHAPVGSTIATITVNGVPVIPELITTTAEEFKPMEVSTIGMYIDTSNKRFTKPITGLNQLNTLKQADLIIGNEATQNTTGKYIQISQQILTPYNQMILSNPQIEKWSIYSGSLTWMASVAQNQTDGTIENAYMAKIPYTKWAGTDKSPVNKTDSYNFADGLEQRYGVEALGSRENQLFQKLNGIGNNEEVLLYQAMDEMMGHQYGNVQQRINATGNTLDKEFNHLQKNWQNPSKQNNKIKVFGMKDEYKTDTAGIIDYTSNAYGVAYVHEDEKIKMGNSSGWYAGAVTNRFKFKDIGHSSEDQTMIKAGIFKKKSPKNDYNGALQWTIGGDVFAGINNMKRKFLVVDDIFEAKSNYNSYGAALKTDLGYDIRMSERTHLRPYGALKMEYGRFDNIKEDSGEMRLQVKGNDYFSVKPEAGVEFKYVQPLAVRTNLTVGVTAAYEKELGKVGNVNNEAKVRYTNADWFGIRGEKEDRRGNGKFDLNIGVDNTRFGVTVNAGYDTKGNNVRGGIGFRAIY